MNSHKLIHCLILVFVLGLLGCTKDNNMNIITEYIGIVVEGTTMEPVPNVTVAVTNGSRVLVHDITDARGAFSFMVDFGKVTERDSLLLDGSPLLPYQKKYELKGMGKEQYDYRDLVLYNQTDYELKTFQFAGTTYYVHPEVGEMNWLSAMDFCENLTYEGYSDWFLPNMNELNAMYVYRNSIGGFATSSSFNYDCCYWSSTEFIDDCCASCLDFSSGREYCLGWGRYFRVRPVRRD